MNEDEAILDAALRQLFQEAFPWTNETEAVLVRRFTRRVRPERQPWIAFSCNLMEAQRQLKLVLQLTNRMRPGVAG